MSQENVERLREATERGQHDPEHFFALIHPEVDWVSYAVISPDAEGMDAVRRFYREWFGAFADIAFEWEEMIDAGDAVMTTSHWHGTGKTSGVKVEQRLYSAWTFRDGKVVRYRDFADRAAALKAAGLDES